MIIMENNNSQEELLTHIDLLHTTPLGIERIQRNLGIDEDVVEWCKEKILDKNSSIERKGKNWYIVNNHCCITVNAYSYTIITAHRLK